MNQQSQIALPISENDLLSSRKNRFLTINCRVTITTNTKIREFRQDSQLFNSFFSPSLPSFSQYSVSDVLFIFRIIKVIELFIYPSTHANIFFIYSLPQLDDKSTIIFLSIFVLILAHFFTILFLF